MKLSKENHAFIAAQIEAGHFSNEEEALNALVEKLRRREAGLQQARHFIQDGIDSGPPEPFDFDDFLARCAREDAEINGD